MSLLMFSNINRLEESDVYPKFQPNSVKGNVMDNSDLQNLIDNIAIEASNDALIGASTTKVRLKEAERTPAVIEALRSKFQHYVSVTVEGDRLVLVHPKQDSTE